METRFYTIRKVNNMEVRGYGSSSKEHDVWEAQDLGPWSTSICNPQKNKKKTQYKRKTLKKESYKRENWINLRHWARTKGINVNFF